jgi:hypothetical protein
MRFLKVFDVNNDIGLNEFKRSRVSKASTLPPEKTEKVHIYFKQPAVDKNFTYILSSTRSWNKPLDKARFTINTNSDINGLNFSYPFELTPSENENYNYIFTANKFYPETELELSWE